ncbi:MAG: hypothetical protein KGI24_08105 [Candidatus Omnitrophica bacterium]|nr:hypothetical protein [Candidatus Omnitrophota bacterium]MDE2231908.1 hypothetical protein [Candidatus Omnitrophota bacterium]
MNDLLLIACGAGLRDGLNPCMFMGCALFIIHGLWLKQRFLSLAGSPVVFALVYFLGILFFNFTFGQLFILNKVFILTAQVAYLLLSVWVFVWGALFLKDWFLLSRGGVLAQPADGKKLSWPQGIIIWLVTVVLAAALSALATLWPVNKYMLLLGNMAVLRGQWQTGLPLLISYALVGMWPLWLVWAFLSVKNLRLSWLKIVCASVFFTASSCVMLLFK